MFDRLTAGDFYRSLRLDPALLRPAEVDHLIGNATKARTRLAWKPSVDVTGLVDMMVDADVERRAKSPPQATPDRALGPFGGAAFFA